MIRSKWAWGLVALGAAALVCTGCSESSSGSPLSYGTGAVAAVVSGLMTGPAASSGAPTQPAPAQLISSLTYVGAVPSGPTDKPWYFRMDDPATADNEAARDIAQVLVKNGVDEAAAYDHLTQGGSLAIFVGGLGHESDTLTDQGGWQRPCAGHVQGVLRIPAVQVDYGGPSAVTGVLALPAYQISFAEGVLRTSGLVQKALSAGAGEVRLYGHSKGGDIVQEVTWLNQDEPRVTFALALGVPLWSAAIPGHDPTTGRAGLFRHGLNGNHDYKGKLVLFVRRSDRISHGQLFPPTGLPGPGHDYENVLATPAMMARLHDVGFLEPIGFADRPFGVAFDY